MRFDMYKVIVERPRSYRGCRGRSGVDYPRAALSRARSLDDLPTRESMGGTYREKFLHENLAPLRRFLLANVGRPWNRVLSEIRACVDAASAVQAHVLQHLDDYVASRVCDIDGVLHAIRRWGPPTPLVALGRRLELFVCPRTGLLRRVAPLRAAAAAARPYLQRSERVWWMRRPGGWFALELAALPAWGTPPGDVVDALTRARVGSREHHRAVSSLACPWASTHYVVGLRQLAKKELRVVFQGR